ncbi:MAG: MATE family efflux transporter [Eubacteriales bacterium]|nr:MATE family efflux transporter [Eubacteriales bacterium]
MHRGETKINRIKIDNKALYKNLASIAIPIAIQGVISATLGLVDNLMVGSLGEIHLAAVGIATQIYFIHWMLLYGFTSGSATFMAQFFGANDMKNIRKTIGFAVFVALCIGSIFFIGGTFFSESIIRLFSDDENLIPLASGYIKTAKITFFFLGFSVPFESALKATQQTTKPLYISIAVFGTNTILNYVLIFGKLGAPEMGVNGAALATAIARALELVLVMVVVFVRKNSLAGPIKDFIGWKKAFVFRIFKNALPTTANEALWSMGQAMYVAAFARIGITAYAAYQSAAAINSIFTYAAFSVGDAALILIGQKIGERKNDYTYSMAKSLLKIGTIVGVVAGIVLIVMAKPLVGLFALTELGKQYAIIILLIYGLTMGLNLYNGINVTGVLRGGGDTRFAMFAECGSVWFISVPLAFIGAMYLELPIYLVVLLLKSEEIIKAVILTKRFISKKWLNNVIHGL